MDYYIKTNKFGLYSQFITIFFKALTYLFVLKFISKEIYGSAVLPLTLMGFSLILSDSGGSSSIFAHKKVDTYLINQYFSSSISYSLILSFFILTFGVFQKNWTEAYIYFTISILVSIAPLNNILISIIQKLNHTIFFYYSRNFRDLFSFLFSIFLIYIKEYKLSLFLPYLFGEIILFCVLFRFTVKKISKINITFKIEKKVIQRNYHLFFAKILNYFSLNWVYLGFINFIVIDIATLNMANSFWKNISDALKNIFQKSYLMIPFNNAIDVKSNTKYFLNFNLKYLLPLVLLASLSIYIFLNYYASGKWENSAIYILIFGIYGSILFIFPPLTPVYIVNDKTSVIFNNSVILFTLNLITIIIVYILKLPLMYAFILSLFHHVISYLLLFIGLNKIFK